MTTDVTTAKEILGIYHPGSTHMVGDGFPVRNLFPSNDLDRSVDPFLMLDYAGPQHFSATDHPRESASIPIADLRRSPSCMTARWRTGIRQATPASLAQETSSG
jgi:hypothetical protein